MENCNIFEIWEEYKSSLFLYIKLRVRDEDDTKDILQDVLLKSYQYCNKGKTVLHLKSWLYKITQNTIIDHYRKNSETIPFEFDFIETENENSIVGEASDYIYALLQLLPNDYATPLYMSDIEGIDQKVIADKLGISLVNTKARIQRARVKLKQRFLECCVVGFNDNGEMVSFDIKPECTLLKEEKTRIENKV